MKKKQWKGGPRSSLSYKMDMMRKAKDEKDNPEVVRPHYRKNKRGGFSTVRAHVRR